MCGVRKMHEYFICEEEFITIFVEKSTACAMDVAIAADLLQFVGLSTHNKGIFGNLGRHG